MPLQPDYSDFDDEFEAECWNCGGEGFVANCFEEWACLYPEDGCDLCIRRCDVCRPRTASVDRSGEAIETAKTGSTEGESAVGAPSAETPNPSLPNSSGGIQQ